MNKLIQGAEERLVNLWEFTLLKDPDRTLKEDMIPFLKTELETIVKESFKNTRVEEEELIEKLADIEHTRWSKWQEYVFSKMKREVINDIEYHYLPNEFYQRWARQIDTPYTELSEAEKESDRKEARISLNQALSDKHNKENHFLDN